MRILIRVGHNQKSGNGTLVRLLNWLVRENEDYIRRHPSAPLLYTRKDGFPIVVYQREAVETWQDLPMMIRQGHEDCDSLSAARAGELRARGWRAIEPGYSSYALAQQIKPPSIHAECFLRTVNHQEYHCLVRYKLAGRWFYDDPSARLGMYKGVFQSPETVERLLLQQAKEIEKMTVLTPAWHKFMKIGG